MKNSSSAGSTTRGNDSVSNSGQLTSDMVVQMEACSLGEIPPNLSEELVPQQTEGYVCSIICPLLNIYPQEFRGSVGR